MRAQPQRLRQRAPPPPPLKRSQWPDLCRHAKALNDGIIQAGLVSSEIFGNITKAEIEHLVDELERTLELAVGEVDFLLGLADRFRVLALHAASAQALLMLAAAPLLLAVVAGGSLWLLLRWGACGPLRLFGDAVALGAAALAAGGSGAAVVAGRRLAPNAAKQVRALFDALILSTKRDTGSNFDTLCDVAFSLALAYEVPSVRQQFCRLPWAAAAVLLAVELLVSVCCGGVLAFAGVLLACAAQGLLTGAAAMALAPRDPWLDCPPGATPAERVAAVMGRSPAFAAAAAALAAGLAPMLEARLGLVHLNEEAEDRLRSLRVTIKELHLMRRSLIKAARNALNQGGVDWSLRGAVVGVTAGVAGGVSVGVESMSSGVSSIAAGASSLLFG